MSKNRNRKQSENVTDRRCYTLFTRQEQICSFCPPHRGCNQRYDGSDRSWKNFRKHQWK